MGIQRDADMNEATEIFNKPPVGGMDLCQGCGHPQWEHNVDIVVDGEIVRCKNEKRLSGHLLARGIDTLLHGLLSKIQ